MPTKGATKSKRTSQKRTLRGGLPTTYRIDFKDNPDQLQPLFEATFTFVEKELIQLYRKDLNGTAETCVTSDNVAIRVHCKINKLINDTMLNQVESSWLLELTKEEYQQLILSYLSWRHNISVEDGNKLETTMKGNNVKEFSEVFDKGTQDTSVRLIHNRVKLLENGAMNQMIMRIQNHGAYPNTPTTNTHGGKPTRKQPTNKPRKTI